MCNLCPQVELEPVVDVADEQAAYDHLDAVLDRTDEQYRDNHRFAFADDEAAMVVYDRAVNDGCCGSIDLEIRVAGRRAFVGCNYGH